ncbi:MAG: MFS transporter [Dehalococcoidia bacterium]
MASIRTFDSLRIRDYRLLWLGQVSTSMGQWMDQFTRAWLIYEITGSPFQLGAVTAARGLPLLLFGILAGAFADRSGRKMQLIVAQVTNGGLNFILAVLVITGHVQEWHVYVTAFLAGSVQAFQQPARQTLISDLVPENRLLNALALNSAALNSSRTIGPAVAGLVIAGVGTGGSYMLQAIMYLFATLWTFQIVIPARVGARDEDGQLRERLPFVRSVAEGLAFAAREPNIRAQLLLGLGPLTFAMSYTALMPLIAINVLHGSATLGGTLLSSIGIGSLIGALVVASMQRRTGYGLSVVLGAIAFAVSLFAFASSNVVWLSLALGTVLGLFNVTYTTQNQSLLQIMTPRPLRGRVMSIYLLNRGLAPVGALVAGFLAEHFGGQDAMRGLSIIALVIVAVVVATHTHILRLEVPLGDRHEDRGAERGAPGGRVGLTERAGRDPTTVADEDLASLERRARA